MVVLWISCRYWEFDDVRNSTHEGMPSSRVILTKIIQWGECSAVKYRKTANVMDSQLANLNNTVMAYNVMLDLTINDLGSKVCAHETFDAPWSWKLWDRRFSSSLESSTKAKKKVLESSRWVFIPLHICLLKVVSLAPFYIMFLIIWNTVFINIILLRKIYSF